MSAVEETKKEEEIKDLRNADVVTKYKAVGEIANATVKAVAALCAPGAKIIDICTAGDALITESVGKIYNKGKIDKGIAFPTCISVNNIVGHFSPVAEDTTELKEGDMIKIDLGVHVDGYNAVVADTIICGGGKATGKAGDVLAAAHFATEAAIRMLKAGAKNTAITEMISKVADDFKVNAVQGVLSHSMEQFVLDGDKTIINKEDVEQKVDEKEFETNEVYAVDIVMSTGTGKPIAVDDGTTVYKKTDKSHQLKLKASRTAFGDIKKRFPKYPFTMRMMTDKGARLGVKFCLQHELVAAYPVLTEKEGEMVAHVKFTALLMPGGTTKIAGPELNPAMFETDKAVTDEEIKKLLLTSAATKKKKKNNKKKKAPTDAAATAE